jgi:hypothetical protein
MLREGVERPATRFDYFAARLLAHSMLDLSLQAATTIAVVAVIEARRVAAGCGGRTRTSDHRINNPALYQLSYTTVFDARAGMVDDAMRSCQR